MVNKSYQLGGMEGLVQGNENISKQIDSCNQQADIETVLRSRRLMRQNVVNICNVTNHVFSQKDSGWFVTIKIILWNIY